MCVVTEYTMDSSTEPEPKRRASELPVMVEGTGDLSTIHGKALVWTGESKRERGQPSQLFPLTVSQKAGGRVELKSKFDEKYQKSAKKPIKTEKKKSNLWVLKRGET